jgi:hypothetical protein
MIIYGWHPAKIKTIENDHLTCPECGTRGSLVYTLISKHAHIFWIPFFPYGKEGLCQCSNEDCEFAYEGKYLQEDIKLEFDEIKRTTKPPIWQFSGIILIAAIILLSSFFNAQDKKEEAEFIASPEIGDSYNFKTETGNYSVIKVVGVIEDTIVFIQNDYEVNQTSGLKDIDIEKNYTIELFVISIAEIQEMHNDGEIINVERKKNFVTYWQANDLKMFSPLFGIDTNDIFIDVEPNAIESDTLMIENE